MRGHSPWSTTVSLAFGSSSTSRPSCKRRNRTGDSSWVLERSRHSAWLARCDKFPCCCCCCCSLCCRCCCCSYCCLVLFMQSRSLFRDFVSSLFNHASSCCGRCRNSFRSTVACSTISSSPKLTCSISLVLPSACANSRSLLRCRTIFCAWWRSNRGRGPAPRRYSREGHGSPQKPPGRVAGT